jgi:hypothetical protein
MSTLSHGTSTFANVGTIDARRNGKATSTRDAASDLHPPANRKADAGEVGEVGTAMQEKTVKPADLVGEKC